MVRSVTRKAEIQCTDKTVHVRGICDFIHLYYYAGQMGRSPRRSGRQVKQRILYGQPGAPGATPQSQSKKTGETPESGSDEGEEEEGGGGHEEAG